MEIELKVEQSGMQGQGVAHDTQGNIYFIPGSVPGDRILARFEETTKRYRDAELVTLLEPSADRVDPRCQVFAQCGGCDWLNWKYASQIKAKEQILKHVFERGEWLPEKWLPTLEAKNPLGYRNRIQLHSDGKRLGFYRKKSHDVVDVENCPVTHASLNSALTQLRESTPSLPKKVELTLMSDGSVARLDDQPHAAAGFGQVHGEQNEVLRATVAGLLAQAQSETVLELFCGNGNLTTAYRAQVGEVFAVDCSAPALASARQQMKHDGLKPAVFMESRVDSKLFRRLPREFRERYDTILLDPPRAGAEGCLRPLIHDAVKTIVYVSCAPVAFSKDVACLKEAFQFEQVQIIDMFPHTRHIEFVALFTRRLQ